MKAKLKKFRDSWYGLEPDMPKEEQRLSILFQQGSRIIPLSLIFVITFGLYDWQRLTVIIALVIQICWLMYFGIKLKRKRKERLPE